MMVGSPCPTGHNPVLYLHGKNAELSVDGRVFPVTLTKYLVKASEGGVAMMPPSLNGGKWAVWVQRVNSQ